MSGLKDLAGFTVRQGELGLRRSQLIVPRPDRVDAAVEDDIHHFRVTLHHDGAVVSRIEAGAVERWPWSTCPAAADHLAQRLTGASLEALAAVDPPQAHCTHMHELALLAASHAGDAAPTLYTSFIADPVDGTQEAEVWVNGELALALTVRGSLIVAGGALTGRDFRQYRQWEGEVPTDQRRVVKVMRRVVQITGGRPFNYAATPSADYVVQSTGACFTFQPERAATSLVTVEKREFSFGPPPLASLIAEVADGAGWDGSASGASAGA